MERRRDAERQISINSMWSLQPHCGNFYCGPQIKQNGLNLWCHPRLQLAAAVFSVCSGVGGEGVCVKHISHPSHTTLNTDMIKHVHD